MPAKPGKVKIIIVDDHPITREGLKGALTSRPGFSVTGEAENGEQALGIIEKERPDIVFMDISMPDMDGIEATRRIVKSFPGSKVIIVSMHLEQHYAMDAFRAGAMGYVLKGSDASEMLAAADKVLGGSRYASPAIADGLFSDLVDIARKKEALEPFDALTAREKEVLGLIASGLKNREIAKRLFISQYTVKTHRINIMRKLDAHDTTALTKIALRKGLIQD